MPKSSKEQIEADEKKVIRELQRNSKESIDEIAKKCGFSRQKVWRIINRLEKNKIIWGYHAVVDVEKLKLRHYIILAKKVVMSIENTANKIISRDIERKAEEIGVTIHGSHYLHGNYDWQICFTAKDIATAKKFCNELASFYHPIIKDLVLLETIFTVKEGGIENPNVDQLKTFL
jgi:DNA-binding Lrp family transcriptional regulator